MTSLLCHQSHVWINYAGDIIVADVVSPSTFGFVINMSGKCKSTSPSAIQVKNQRQTVSAEEKLDIISQLEKGK